MVNLPQQFRPYLKIVPIAELLRKPVLHKTCDVWCWACNFLAWSLSKSIGTETWWEWGGANATNLCWNTSVPFTQLYVYSSTNPEMCFIGLDLRESVALTRMFTGHNIWIFHCARGLPWVQHCVFWYVCNDVSVEYTASVIRWRRLVL